MPNTTGSDWSAGDPANNANVSEYPPETRALRAAVKARMDKEHVALATSGAGGEHLAGSAVSFIGTSAPTKRPDTTTDLDSDDEGRLWWDGTTLWSWDGSAWECVFSQAYALLRESQSAGTQGGDLTQSSWNKRSVTEVYDPAGIVSVSGGAFTLGAGTYRIRAYAVGYKVNGHITRLQNTSDASTPAIGSAGYSDADYGGNDKSELNVELTIASSKTFELQHNCNQTKTGNGKGQRTNLGVTETYAQVMIEKIK